LIAQSETPASLKDRLKGPSLPLFTHPSRVGETFQERNRLYFTCQKEFQIFLSDFSPH
jgi:hypothetical protein